MNPNEQKIETYLNKYPDAIADPAKAEVMATASSELEEKVAYKKANPDSSIEGLVGTPSSVEELEEDAELIAGEAARKYSQEQDPELYARLNKLEP